jgi:hypothetical protein
VATHGDADDLVVDMLFVFEECVGDDEGGEVKEPGCVVVRGSVCVVRGIWGPFCRFLSQVDAYVLVGVVLEYQIDEVAQSGEQVLVLAFVKHVFDIVDVHACGVSR